MSISEKQLRANGENAKKGGPKKEEAKAIVRYNARKHNLLTKEIVITHSEGAESQEEFDSLLADLQDQYIPKASRKNCWLEK